MPFESEFKKHLRSLASEVYEKTIGEIEEHKREILFKAQATRNSAATPIAYKDAELYAMEFRLSRTIESYIRAVEIWGYSIDAQFERDMLAEFWSLTSGSNQLQFPPAIKRHNTQAVQGAYAQERQRLAARLVREGKNRLLELKVKTIQNKRAVEGTTNSVFYGPVGNAYINSPVVQTTNNFDVTAQIIADLEILSEGNAELQAAALEIRNAQSHGANTLDKFQKWATLANTFSGLGEKIHQYYPHIAALVEHFRYVKT